MSDVLWDRLKGAFAALVQVLTARFDYGALYAATVKSQQADGTLGLVFDDPRWPPADGIPVRAGLPGVTLKVSAGARCLVGFENQDASKPRVMQWESPGLVELHVDPSVAVVFSGGSASVGRVGDSVSPTSTMNTWIGNVTSYVNGLAPGTLVAPTGFGSISSGAPKVKA
jgi:hypothetical protein